MIKKVNLVGKTALITGATGAIGSAIAKTLAQNGVNLVLMSSKESTLQKLKSQLRQFECNIDIKCFTCDFSSLKNLEILANQTLVHLKPNILINSAGFFRYSKINKISINDYTYMMNINLNAAFILCSVLSPAMSKAKWGRIVNIGSSSAYTGFRETSAYCISKHGLLGLSRSLHDELKEFGVRVYSISPSSTTGPMGQMVRGQDYRTFLDPEEVSEYVKFVISFDGNAMSEEIMIKRMFLR